MKSTTRDEFKKGVRDVLAHSAGFRCSKPDCRAATAGPSSVPDEHSSVGIAAHITAAAAGGPRYDPTLSSEERSSTANGLWLCDIHAREVDSDTTRFTVDILRVWKKHAEEEARAMLGRPLSAFGLDVRMEVTLQRDHNDGLLVVGQTNLPDATKLMASVRSNGKPSYHAQAHCSVWDRYLLLGPFTDQGRPLPQCWYQIEIYAHFNGPWQQPAHVLDIIGPNGKRLAGRFAHPLDPDVDDTDYSVQACFECPAQALRSEPPLSSDEVCSAITLLQESTLDVAGHDEVRSSECVGDVVKGYLKSPGLREHEGWNANVTLAGIVEVTYSFWNGEHPAISRWQVMPRSKEIRYRNRHAKMMSWSPDY